ncbi:hypothetical protein LXL04_027693 [Taraxacum kok-saghyz]
MYKQTHRQFRQMDPSPSTGNLQTPKRSATIKDESPIPEPLEDAEFSPLSGKPYFYVVLGKLDYGRRLQLVIPRELTVKLPTFTVPAKIVYRGKVWDLPYFGDQSKRRFGNEGWRKFVSDNNLVSEDACLFELIEGSLKSSIVKFHVHILKSNFPSELMEKADGFNKNNPIAID